MASKTRVEGERVTIDDTVYFVKPAGSGQYSVADDFGGRLGYFTMRGKTIVPEDYGVADAHPVMQIAKLWVAANLQKADDKGPEVQTKGVCRITTHERPSPVDAEKARAHRAWLKKQPGCKASYFVLDPATGKAMSISIWEDREKLAQARDAAPPDGAAPLKHTSAEVYPIVEEP